MFSLERERDNAVAEAEKLRDKQTKQERELKSAMTQNTRLYEQVQELTARANTAENANGNMWKEMQVGAHLYGAVTV